MIEVITSCFRAKNKGHENNVGKTDLNNVERRAPIMRAIFRNIQILYIIRNISTKSSK